MPLSASIPKPFKLKSHDRLVIGKGWGCQSLFGIPFFAVGVFLTLAGLRIIPMGNSESISGWEWLIITAMGLVFLLVGSVLVFGRSWVTIDRARKRVVKQWGLLFPMKEETTSFAAMNQVLLEYDEGDSDTPDQYPISLREQHGQGKLKIASPGTYAQALEQASFLASFLQIPLVDSTTDHERIIGPEQTYEPLAYRDRPENGTDEPVTRPAVMKSHVEISDDGSLVIVFPSKGFRVMTLSGLIVPAAILIYVIPSLLDFFRQTDTPPLVAKIALAFLLFFFVLIPVIGTINAVVRSLRERRTVNVDREGITIKDRAAYRTRTRHIPAGEIFDLDYSAGSTRIDSAVRKGGERYYRDTAYSSRKTSERLRSQRWFKWLEKYAARYGGIIIKTGDEFIVIGADLPDEEVRYLYGLIKGALRRGTTGVRPGI